MRLWTVALVVELVGWLVYIVLYNRSENPEIAAQRKTIRPWLLALGCLLWPFLLVWTIADVLLTTIGRIGRKERE
jgi:hypothetical protein